MIDPLLLDLPTSIETERLLLRTPQAGDGAYFLAALTESLPELRRFLSSLSWVAAEPSLESSEIFCRNAHANFVSRKDLPFFLFERATGQLVGAVGLHRMVWATPKAEVGYWTRTSRSGNGLASEAVTALSSYAFQYLRVVRLELITDEENAGSRRLAERCQFELEGTLRNDQRSPEGSLRNMCIYARLPAADRPRGPHG